MAQLSSFYKTLFSSVRECYEENLYCDVKLFACINPDEESDGNEKDPEGYPDPANMRSVQCHSLVLCSVAPTFKVDSLKIEIQNSDLRKYYGINDHNSDTKTYFICRRMFFLRWKQIMSWKQGVFISLI